MIGLFTHESTLFLKCCPVLTLPAVLETLHIYQCPTNGNLVFPFFALMVLATCGVSITLRRSCQNCDNPILVLAEEGEGEELGARAGLAVAAEHRF